MLTTSIVICTDSLKLTSYDITSAAHSQKYISYAQTRSQRDIGTPANLRYLRNIN